MSNIFVGEQIEFWRSNTEPSGIICVVVDDKHISYNGQKWSLIVLAKHLLDVKWAMASPRYWLCQEFFAYLKKNSNVKISQWIFSDFRSQPDHNMIRRATVVRRHGLYWQKRRSTIDLPTVGQAEWILSSSRHRD